MEEEKDVSAEAAENEQETAGETTEGVTEEVTDEKDEKEEKEEGAGETEETDEPPVARPKKQTAEERIAEITKKRREAERERDYWRDEALKKKEAAKKDEGDKAPAAAVQLPPRPRALDFESNEAYEDALLVWHDDVRTIKVEAARKEKEQREATERQQKEHEEAIERFSKAADKVRAIHPDFDEVMDTPVYSPEIRLALLNSENGPAVAYYLGKPENRDTMNRLKALPIRQLLYELGKLEIKITLAEQAKIPSGAPPPIKAGGGIGAAIIDESKLSDDEWHQREKERMRKKAEDKLRGG